MAKLTKVQAAERAEAVKELRKLLPKGSTVYCVLRHVSSSGMSRRIDFYKINRKRGDMSFLSGYIAKVLGYRRHGDDGLVIGGCGMDMGFHVVNSLSYALHGMKANDGSKHRPGYTLNCRWI